MSKEIKRLLTLLVTAAMLFSMMPVGTLAQEELQIETQQQTDPVLDALEPVTDSVDTTDAVFTDDTAQTDGIDISNAADLVEGIAADAVLAGNGELAMFRFVPGQSGTYCFTDLANQDGAYADTWGALYDTNGHTLLSDDDSGNYNSFMITYELVAGQTYYLGVRFWDEYMAGSFPVKAFRFAVKSLSVDPLELEDHTGGYLSDYSDGTAQGKFYLYQWWDHLNFTVTMDNGTVIRGTDSRFTYEGMEFQLQYENNQTPSNRWTVGNTYRVPVSLGAASTEVSVTITPSQIASVAFAPISLDEGSHGSIQTSWDEENQCQKEYFEYFWWNELRYTVTFTSGVIMECDGTGFNYNGKTYNLEYMNTQSAFAPWTAGNTYTQTVMVGPITANVQVSINTSPITAITVHPITMVENSGGSMYGDWDPDTESQVQYYKYFWWDRLSYDVTFSDGQTRSFTGTGFDYNGTWYDLSWNDSQWYNTAWTKGNTYSEEIRLAGITTTVNVTIEGSPIVGLQVQPLTLQAGQNGHISHYYNPETGKYDNYVYGYDWINAITYDVTLSGGSVLSGCTGNTFSYNGVEYNLDYQDDQYNNHWYPGNTYLATVSVVGVSAQVQVSIAPSPFTNVSLRPITIVENTGGHWSTEWNHELQQDVTYYRYDWQQKLNYTVTAANGDRINGANTGFWYQDQYYSFATVGEQVLAPWTVGNTYTVPAFLCGVRYDVPVTIVESPVQSISVEPVAVAENVGGYYNWDAEGKYFYYDLWYQNVSFTVAFKDGTVGKGSYGQPVEHQGHTYRVENWSSDQYNEHWYAGNTYEASVTVGGQNYPVYVTVSASTENNGYVYLLQNGQAIITGCTLETTLLQIPETIDGYPVVGITDLGNALQYAEELRIPDSVTMLSSEVLGWGPLPMKKLYLGSGIRQLDPYSTGGLTNLEWIEVSPENPWLCSIDGVVYDKEVTTLLVLPKAKKTQHVVPDSVTDVENLFVMDFSNVTGVPNVQLGSGVKDYQAVDGVIYNADMTEVIQATASATGSYVMPDSVESIRNYAFAESNLTSVVLSDSVTTIAYGAFWNSALQEVTIPSSVAFVEPSAFSECEALEKVHISDVAAWSRILFHTPDTNPLYYAHDLYLNGDKITDLVIPDTLERDINQYAFAGGSFTSVTIPSNVLAIGRGAFDGCTNLEKVNITDLGAWASTIFGDETANPLLYARDLYLNGEKVVDLVLPETVANRAYPWDCGIGVGKYAFINGSFETVTVPAYVQTMGYGAFCGCEELKQVYAEDLAAWCEISFAGAEANPLYYACDLYHDGEKVVDLVIPETVAGEVYSYAFVNGSMTSLTLPESVSFIGSYAFENSAVERISFAEGLEVIGYAAFAGSNVQTLELPDSLGYIVDAAFENCADLQSVTFGSKLMNLGGYAFHNTGLQSVTLPDSLSWIGMGSFRDCTSLQSLELGSGITDIPDEAFRNCGLKTLTLPEQINTVGMDSFRDNRDLTKVSITGAKAVVVWGAFANCALDEVELGENITYIGGEAFSGNRLTQLVLPSTVVMISYREFAFNDNLVSVTLPAELEYIGKYSFQGSNNISHVLYTGTADQWSNVYCQSSEINNATLHTGAVGNEVTTEQTCTTVRFYCSICKTWETVKKNRAEHSFEYGVCTACGHDSAWEYEIDAETGTVTVTDYAGTDTHVEIPEQIEGLPVVAFTEQVFAYDSKLVTVSLPDTVTRIPDSAFRGCMGLEEVSLGSQITEIGAYAFLGCEHLLSAQLPDTVQTVGEYAFMDCHWLYMEQLPKNLTVIGEGAFSNCGSLAITELPAGVTQIAYAAFYSTGIRELILPEGVTEIAYQAFSNSALQAITLPGSVASIGGNAFHHCYNLELIRFLGDKPENAQIAFEDGVTAFYPASESWEGTQQRNWYACQNPAITAQPQAVDGWLGDSAVLAVSADGQRLRYQWFLAAPGESFGPVGSNSPELLLTMTEEVSGSRAFCVITDVLGQTAQTETVSLTAQEKPVMQITTLPSKLDYLLGEKLDNTGMVVTLTWSDGRTETLESYELTGFDPNTAGKQTVTVHYNGLTASYQVTVTDPYSGSCGENLTWKVDGEVLTISGTGVMSNFTTSTQPWKDFRSTITTVVVEEGVTSVGNHAFYYCRKITNVTLPACLATVGTKAFYKTDALTDVFYGGTAEQWSAVTMAADNDPLTAATLHTTEVVTGIDIVFGPSKTEYWVGEDLELDGLTMNYLTSDGMIVPLLSGYTVTGYDANMVGEQTVTVTYEGFTATFTVTVNQKTVQEVAVTTLPNKTVYALGEALDTTGIVLTVTWSDGSTEMVTEGFGIANYDPNLAGEQSVSVFYRGVEGSFTVTVEGQPATLVSVEVTTLPNKTVYALGEELDTTGMVVTATWSDGSTDLITDAFAIADYDPNWAGEQTVSVYYRGMRATFTVTVEAEPVLIGISYVMPDKTEYWVGEELDLTGLEVFADYTGGHSQIISDYTVSGYDPQTVGEQTITVSYEGFTVSFTVNVAEQLVNEEVGQVIIDNAQGIVGRTVDVKLTLQNNPGIASMRLKVHFDSSVLILTEVIDGGILGENVHKPEMTSPYTLCWANDLATENFTENGTLVTLRFTIAEDAPEGIYTVTATYDAAMGDVIDKDLLDVEMEIISGSVDVSTVLLGDVNGDGSVNARDRAILARYLADWEGYADQVDLQAADVNRDGQVDIRDRAVLTRYLADWEGYTQLPYGG